MVGEWEEEGREVGGGVVGVKEGGEKRMVGVFVVEGLVRGGEKVGVVGWCGVFGGVRGWCDKVLKGE